MNIATTKTSFVLLLSTIAAQLTALPANAQTMTRPKPNFTEMVANPRVSPTKSIDIPCCQQCSKGGEQVIDLSTGVAPWISPQGNASVISPYPGWESPSSPAKWVYTGTNNAPATYLYQLKINVPKNCKSLPKVTYSGTGFGDNNITVRMDDKVLGTTAISSAGAANYGFRSPYGVNISGNLGAGSHILSVSVRNDESVTGFLFMGKLSIKCPEFDSSVYTSGDQPVY